MNLCGDRAALEELVRFYRPYYAFDRIPVEDPDVEVYANVVVASGAIPRDPVTDMTVYLRRSSFAVVTPGIRYSKRPVTGIDVFVVDEREVHLFAQDRTELALQLRTLVRDQLLQQVQKRNGAFMLHASAIERGGRGVLFVGERGAGKTTAALAFAARGDYNLVSSDRVALEVDLDKVSGVGFPFRCNIHRIAFDSDPLAQLAASAGGFDIAADGEGKVLVPMDLLACVAGVEVRARFRLASIVLPVLEPTERGMTVCSVDGVENVADVLQRNELCGGENDRCVEWLGVFPDDYAGAAKTRRAVARAIAASATVVQVSAARSTLVGAIQTREFDRCVELSKSREFADAGETRGEPCRLA